MADEERRTAGTDAAEGLPDEEFSRLMDGISTVAPLLRSFFSASPEGSKDTAPERSQSDGRQCREALLLALKPYLSPARCAAVDYFIRLSRVGEALRSLQ